MNIGILSDNRPLLFELTAGAAGFAGVDGSIVPIVVGDQGLAQEVASFGACTVLNIELPVGAIVDDAAYSVAQIARDRELDLLLIASTVRGTALAARVASTLGTSCVPDVKRVELAEDGFRLTHLVLGGAASQVDCCRDKVAVVTLGTGVLTASSDFPAGYGSVESVEFVATAGGVRRIGMREKTSSGVDLTQSKVVVCGGRGIADQAGVQLLNDLARALGGDVGCSRPLTEGADPLMPDRDYIGVSGVVVKPELYVGVAVSGQTQHLVGANESANILAINKDPHCLLFRYSDYCLVGDYREVLPLLTEAVSK